MNVNEEFEGLYRVYLAAQREGDIEKIGSLYSEDAILVPAESMPVEGRTAICATYDGPGRSDVEVSLNRVEIEGNLACVTGFGHWNVDGQRQGVVFVDVWRRENGEWRISACISNSSNGFVIEQSAVL